MKSLAKWGFDILGLSLFLSACGAGPETNDLKPTHQIPNDVQFTRSIIGQFSVQAKGYFQNSSIQVFAGEQINISSTGTWTIGYYKPVGGLQYCGGEGCDPLKADGTEDASRGLASQILPDGNVTFNYSNNMPPALLTPGGEKTVPINNQIWSYNLDQYTPGNGGAGFLCSEKTRILSVAFGPNNRLTPYTVFEKNLCAPTKYATLIMKIVPVGATDSANFPVLAAGRNYENTFYTVQTDGEIWFRANDGLGIQDNLGALDISVFKKN